MRFKILLWFLLLVAAFLIGFIPSYSRARTLDQEIAAARLENRELRVRDAIGLAYFEAAQKNFGKAQEASTNFFVQARELSNRTDKPELRKSLQDMLGWQKMLSSKLAQADPSALTDLATLYQQVQQGTGGGA